MKQHKSLALHNAACNPLFYKYQDCLEEHKFGRFLGYCSALHKEVEVCMRKQREINRLANLERKQKKMQEHQNV